MHGQNHVIDDLKIKRTNRRINIESENRMERQKQSERRPDESQHSHDRRLIFDALGSRSPTTARHCLSNERQYVRTSLTLPEQLPSAPGTAP